MFTPEEFYGGGDMFTTKELKDIYERILVTPPFNNVMGRFTEEINKMIVERSIKDA